MTDVQSLVTDNLDIWTSAIQKKNGVGRGSSRKIDLYGIKKLRELILELAVRGKLVPQNSDDEPAFVLLEKIVAEKKLLVKEGKIKKQKTLPEIGEDEKPFELPLGWIWTRLESISQKITDGEHISPNKTDQGTMLLTAKHILEKGVSFDDPQYVSEEDAKKFRLRCDPIIDDILICSRGTIGRSCVLTMNEYFCLMGSVILVRPSSAINSPYLNYFIRSPLGQLYIRGITKGMAVNALYLKDIKYAPIPLPPLREQLRIVEKVDELMALCDELEQQTESSIDAHRTLVETLLNTLTQSQDSGELEQNWNRIAEHFDSLFTTEESVDLLKQTILQLAVIGKLVSQDPDDEPASVLLEKIAAEKKRLVKEGKIKKQKVLPEIGEDEKPFELPKGWEFCCFGELAEFINGDRGKNYPNKNEYVEDGIPWINTGHIEPNGTLSTDRMNYITKEKFEALRSGKIIPTDLVYCLRGATFGKTAFVSPYTEGAIASSLMIIRPYINETSGFIYNFLISPFGKSQLFRFDNGSAQPNLSANSVRKYFIAVPPVSEQHRIKAKVDEIYTLCENLKGNLSDLVETQLNLTNAIVNQAIK